MLYSILLESWDSSYGWDNYRIQRLVVTTLSSKHESITYAKQLDAALHEASELKTQDQDPTWRASFPKFLARPRVIVLEREDLDDAGRCIYGRREPWFVEESDVLAVSR